MAMLGWVVATSVNPRLDADTALDGVALPLTGWPARQAAFYLTQVGRSAPQSSQRDPAPGLCNLRAERFVKAIRSECLDHFVIFGKRHLRCMIKQFMFWI